MSDRSVLRSYFLLKNRKCCDGALEFLVILFRLRSAFYTIKNLIELLDVDLTRGRDVCPVLIPLHEIVTERKYSARYFVDAMIIDVLFIRETSKVQGVTPMFLTMVCRAVENVDSSDAFYSRGPTERHAGAVRVAEGSPPKISTCNSGASIGIPRRLGDCGQQRNRP